MMFNYVVVCTRSGSFQTNFFLLFSSFWFNFYDGDYMIFFSTLFGLSFFFFFFVVVVVVVVGMEERTEHFCFPHYRSVTVFFLFFCWLNSSSEINLKEFKSRQLLKICGRSQSRGKISKEKRDASVAQFIIVMQFPIRKRQRNFNSFFRE